MKLALDPAAVFAFVSWPKFSLTSYRMVCSLKKQGVVPKTIIDVGANVGQFAIATAKIFPMASIHSFEPNPDCVVKLQKNITPLGNVSVYPVALGDVEGEMAFHINSHSHSSSILTLAENHLGAFPDAREVGSIQVKVSTLDKVFANIELNGPVLLKLDVQGYEAQALRGATETLRRVDYVVLEASFKPMYEGEMLFVEIVRLMEDMEFAFMRPVGMLTDPNTGEIIQMDALFRRNRKDGYGSLAA
jgi:FkbM family methyltransferase